jgi:hypothetical protein
MKTSICILTVSALTALSAPISGATIPGDSRSGYDHAERAAQVIQPAGKQSKKKAAKYNQQAYVPGGSSPSVAKAITAQGKRALR